MQAFFGFKKRGEVSENQRLAIGGLVTNQR